MRSLIPLSLLITIFNSPVSAVIFPFNVRTGNPPPPSRLGRRTPIPISNTGNAQYVSNITLGGVTLPVLLDTGSSDLWVHFPTSSPSGMKDTGKSVTLSYAVGKAGGNVQTVQAQMGDLAIPDQAFLNVQDTSTFTSNIHSQGYDGLLGLGPNEGSVIRKKVKNGADTFLQRVFDQNHSTDNYISFLLDRKNDPSDAFKGQFSIAEVIPGFENITSMPKLDVETVNRLLEADQHWQALTDEDNGIIGPDGQPIKMKSIVPKAPKGQFVAVIDSGFTFSQVPRDVSDAIYGRVRGAYYDSQNQWWLVPCGQYLNISFNFAGRNYPIHPLDVVDDNFSRVDNTGKKVCIGAFQPITSAFSLLGHYDMILGMSFLRNAYTLLDFGNWIENSNDQDHPYIQMASLTNVGTARQDFITTRLAGTDTISDARWSLLPADQMQHSPVPPDEKNKKYQELVLSRWPYILTGCLVFVLLMIGLCVWKCCCRKRVKGDTTAASKKGGFFAKKGSKSSQRDSYVALEAKNNRSVNDLTSPFSPNPSQYDLNPPHTPGYHQTESRHSTNSRNGSGADLTSPFTPNTSQYDLSQAPSPGYHQSENRQSNYSQHSYQGQGGQAYQGQDHQSHGYQAQGYQGHGYSSHGYQGQQQA